MLCVRVCVLLRDEAYFLTFLIATIMILFVSQTYYWGLLELAGLCDFFLCQLYEITLPPTEKVDYYYYGTFFFFSIFPYSN